MLDFMRGDDPAAPDELEVEIWRSNWRAVEVFRTCQLTRVGMGAHCTGLSAVEIQTAMRLHQIPRRHRRQMVADLTIMGDAAAHWINANQAKAEG